MKKEKKITATVATLNFCIYEHCEADNTQACGGATGEVRVR